MRILAIDVGTGTKDIMFYNTEKEIENSIKLVLPYYLHLSHKFPLCWYRIFPYPEFPYI